MVQEASKHILDRICIAILWIFVVLDVAIGAQMLAMPMTWYETTPGVTGTGAFNPHFIRDIGIAYLTASMALAYGLLRPAHRYPLFLIALIFFGGHALMHVVEMLHGHTHEGTVIEIIAIVVPAIVLSVMLYRSKTQGPV